MPSHTVADLLRGLAAGDFSSEEITRQYLNDIEQRDGHYNSFISVTAEQALDQARAIVSDR